jgi:hypothetical protein
MRYILFILSFLLVSCSPPNFTYHDWHIKEREYDFRDSVFVPVVECSDIVKTTTGQTFKEVYDLTGSLPVKNYFHPGIALLRTNCDNRKYEVAIKYDMKSVIDPIAKDFGLINDFEEKVLGISFKPQTSLLYK